MAKATTTKTAGAAKPKAAAKPRTANTGAPNALQQPLTPSKELGAIVGTDKIARGQVVSKMWEYIKKNNLQNPDNKREIMADAKLEPIFGAKKVTMFEMNKHLAKHLTK